MDNEQSITFISSKFIKSNSVESIPDLQGGPPRHLRQLSNREETTSDFALSTNVGGCGGGGNGVFSDTNPSHGGGFVGPISVHPYKKRNHGSLVEPSF
jgi:hypothetical protein